jgi:hypothetical protein
MTAPDEDPRPPAPPRRALAGDPVLPEQSREDTDAGWGDYREQDDDRLRQERPPHWDDA